MRGLVDNLKNVLGWRTSRKIVVLCIDDYGNVRVDSKGARQRMSAEGLRELSRFDSYDCLETTEDLEMLFDTLRSVKDLNGRHCVATPLVVPCNIDFERMQNEGYEVYFREELPVTFSKLSATRSAYEGTWRLWQQGIENSLLLPEFHGREHFNVSVFHEMLRQKDRRLMISLRNRSLTGLGKWGSGKVKYTAAFGYWQKRETEEFFYILDSGVRAFESIFGWKPNMFTPPSYQFPSFMESLLPSLGLQSLDKPFIAKEHLGEGKYRTTVRIPGRRKNTGLIDIVRNVVFEPTETGTDRAVNLALTQIDKAFRWRKPAVISSHRVNFCGFIDPRNRKEGITALKILLSQVARRWPDIEFVSAGELTSLMGRSE